MGLELGEEGEVVEVVWANRLEGRIPKKRQAKNANARSQTEVERMLAPAAVLVAVVASGGTVGITVDSTVLTVRSSLSVIVVGMAVDTSKAGVVGGNLVAVVAHGLVMRDGEVGVIESGAEPTGGGVASVAGSWIACREVIRDTAAESLRADPSSLVATVASSVRSGEAVIVVDVASGAGSFSGVQVCAGERPAGGGVIKGAGIPRGCVVAGGAERSGKACGNVIRHGTAESSGGVPFIGVAAVASGVGGSKIVIVVEVAVGAGCGEVRAS